MATNLARLLLYVNSKFFLTSLATSATVSLMNNKRPILFISDAVSGTSGLARITRDISTRVHEHLGDLYRVASYGYGSPGSSKIPFPQFVIEGMHEWLMPTLPQVCDDFFGKEKGIICTVFDLLRLTWLAAPKGASDLFGRFPGLQHWAVNRSFELFGYIPVDSSGPNDKLTFPLMRTLLGFDRLLAYTQFGEDVIRRTIGDEESNKRHLTNLPHGIDSEIFWENDRKLSRKLFLEYTGAQNFLQMLRMQDHTDPIADDEILIGIVATNQYRKDWSIAAEVVNILGRNRKIRLWVHTDDLERYWSLPNLLIDFGVLDRTIISLGTISDQRMATAYSACDLTLGIGPEGYGYPIHESMFCGTPCISGDYGGAPEYMAQRLQRRRIFVEDEPLLVQPAAFRYEGSYASKRPVYNAQDWADKAQKVIGSRVNHCAELDWEYNWPLWESYLREAAK